MQKAAQRHDAPTFPRCEVKGKSQQTLSLGEAIKGTGESN